MYLFIQEEDKDHFERSYRYDRDRLHIEESRVNISIFADVYIWMFKAYTVVNCGKVHSQIHFLFYQLKFVLLLAWIDC